MADTIEDLAEQIRQCTKCPLHKARNNAVPGTGNPNARVVMIGEGPGENEDKQGRPFVGGSGKYLDRLLADAGLDRRDMFVTNIVKCRPPENRTPTQDEKGKCRDWLERQLAAIRPDLVVTMGAPATQHFAPQAKIGEAHGQPMHVDGREFVILPIYHPAAALRQERYRQPIEEEFPRIREWMDIIATPAEETDPPKEPAEAPYNEQDAMESLTEREQPKRPPQPTTEEPRDGALLATARTVREEMQALLRQYRRNDGSDPAATRHGLTVLSTIFQTTRRELRRLPEGTYRDWVAYHLKVARMIGAYLGESVPLTCEDCGETFVWTTDEFEMERWCPECREQ